MKKLNGCCSQPNEKSWAGFIKWCSLGLLLWILFLLGTIWILFPSSENKSWYSPVLGRVRLYFVVFLKLQRRHMGCVGSGSVSPSLAPECCSFRMNDQQSTLPISNSYSVWFWLGIMIWHWYKWNKCVKKYIDTYVQYSTQRAQDGGATYWAERNKFSSICILFVLESLSSTRQVGAGRGQEVE